MSEKHIYIFGEIGSENTLQSVAKQTKGTQPEDTLIVHIHSQGGDVTEGFAIYDHLLSFNAKVETRIEGLCASIATIIAMSGSVRKMTENSTFFIHNPWTMISGDANELIDVAEELKSVENKIATFYSKKTGKAMDMMKGLMNQAKDITPDEAYKLGFITQIVKPVLALAQYKPNHTNLEKQMSNFLNKIESKIKAILNQSETEIKNLDAKTSDGVEIVIDGETIEVGYAVTLKETGEPAPEGTHTLEDGTQIVVADGLISEVIPVSDSSKSIDEVIAENSVLKTEIENLKNENEQIKNKFEDFIKALEQKQPTFNRVNRSTPKNQDKKFDRTGGANVILSKTKYSKTK
jgi:ATP-dependent Clp protease protease subunit